MMLDRQQHLLQFQVKKEVTLEGEGSEWFWISQQEQWKIKQTRRILWKWLKNNLSCKILSSFYLGWTSYDTVYNFSIFEVWKVYLLGIIFRKILKNELHQSKRYTKNEGEMRFKKQWIHIKISKAFLQN